MTTTAERKRYVEITDAEDTPSFASPSGRLWCIISADSAACMTDYIDQKSLPRVRDCYDFGYSDRPNVVLLEGKAKARFMCDNGGTANPERNSGWGEAATAWVEGNGTWVKVTLAGRDTEVAALPYGKAMRAGHMICTSEDFGITCVNNTTGHGFLIRHRGVVMF